MPQSYDLIKEQGFFRRELRERVSWFINLRWIAGGAALAACIVGRLMGLTLPELPIGLIGVFVLFYNGCLLVASRRLSVLQPERLEHFTAFLHIQISLDLVALSFALFFTGGINSPLLILVILHVVLAGIFLDPWASYLYGAIMVLVMGGAVILGKTAASLLETITGFQHSFVFLDAPEPHWILAQYLVFASAVIFSAYTITTVKVSLRTKARELQRISRELDASNTKLTALYEMVKEIGAITDLKRLLDTATLQAAAIMGVKACSIKLLDDQKKHLEFSSTYGLSEDYLSMGKLDLEKSPINRRIIDGSPYVIADIDKKDHFQFPENIQKEGIVSMLCLPLRGNSRVLGVFCVYGMADYTFQERDVDFFILMSDLVGIAIERVKWDLTKSWFMAKVTHNLRSPLNAVFSMVSLVRKGYLGTVNDKQAETLERCESRIQILADLVGDLLKIGRERTEMGKVTHHPVAPESVVQPLIPLFQNQSVQKGIEISFEIDDNLPKILANEGLIEDLFANLISNAIKYTMPGGRVTVELGTDDRGRFRFDVSDTGIGIAESDMPNLFSEFFRAENAKQLAEQGTGLGLAIVKETVDRLGGSIQVRSKVGEGTRFTCFIPPCVDH
jgi:K+-sensing histidine kinase KdpD